MRFVRFIIPTRLRLLLTCVAIGLGLVAMQAVVPADTASTSLVSTIVKAVEPPKAEAASGCYGEYRYVDEWYMYYSSGDKKGQVYPGRFGAMFRKDATHVAFEADNNTYSTDRFWVGIYRANPNGTTYKVKSRSGQNNSGCATITVSRGETLQIKVTTYEKPGAKNKASRTFWVRMTK